MAELGILSSVAGKILGWLADPAAQQIGLLWNVTKELEDLQRTLSAVNAVLADAERKKQIGDGRVKLWLEWLEGVIEEADDLMDEFSNEDLRRQVMFGDHKTFTKQVCTFFSSSNQVAFRHKMAHKLRDLKEKLDKIKNDAQLFGLVALPQVTTNIVSIERDTHSYVAEENVLGRDAEKMAILKLLNMDDINETEIDGEVLVIPIVGVGGLGKTTLAQFVFNDDKVKQHFNPKMWVCVSEDFDVKSLLKRIIQAATGDTKAENLDKMEELQKELQNAISGKRYLLVLDDVWNENPRKWQSLKELLDVGAKDSRIILTTRSKKVANITSHFKPYHLGRLDEDKSWTLFRKMAFKKGEEPKDSKSLREFREQLVKKCDGRPLAIKVIGRMLYSKSQEEWLSLVKNNLHEICQNKDEEIFQTLRLSYDHLPSDLKACFVYCSLFPKDYEIRVQMLIKFWMAQGFIKSTNKCWEDVGYDYFEELLWRSFFQEVKKDVLGNVVSCKMHDLMHDLASSLGEKKCMILNDKKTNIDKEVRHLSFDFHLDSPHEIQATSTIQADRLRSIIECHKFYYKSESYKSFCKEIVQFHKLLRLLDLQNLRIKTVPNSISELKYLRYLDLSRNEFKILPKSITSLLNLQTLKLNYCRSLEELPRDIKRLVNLRHLEIEDCDGLTSMPSGLGKLTNLQTLSTFVLRQGTGSCSAKPSAKLDEVANLNNLRGKLTVKNLKDGMDSKVGNFKDKTQIKSLNLSWDSHARNSESKVDHEITLKGFQPLIDLKKLILDCYGGVSLPSWLPSTFFHLIVFELNACRKVQHLPLLNQFGSLEILKLMGLDDLEYVNVKNNSESFAKETMPSLKILHLKSLPKLKSWWRDIANKGEENSSSTSLMADNQMLISVFPSLLELEIWNCPQLNHMPLYPWAEKVLLVETSGKPLEETILMKAEALSQISSTVAREKEEEEVSVSTSTVIPPSLSKLKFLTLIWINDLQFLADVTSLSCLKVLRIEQCPKLEYLCSSIQHLSSLQYLRIAYCPELIEICNKDESSTWQSLKSLNTIELCSLPKLKALPIGLQHVTTVQTLSLDECGNLMAIPNWIGNLTSLTTFEIVDCPKVALLPDSIQGLTSLQHLTIADCPVLKQRYQKETGEDWPKIAHIPHLNLEFSYNVVTRTLSRQLLFI